MSDDRRIIQEKNGEVRVLASPDDSDGSPGAATVGGLSNDQIIRALATLDVIGDCEGSLLECREQLISLGLHPNEPRLLYYWSPTPKDDPVEEEIPFSLNEDPPRDEDVAKKFALHNYHQVDEVLDWAADHAEPEEIDHEDEVPAFEPSSSRLEREGVSAGQVEQMILKHFSTLYESLKVGLDGILSINQELRDTVKAQAAELKLLRKEQNKLGASLAGISAKVDALHVMVKDGQYDIQELKQDVSICTSGFTKINSALLQMNAAGIPQGSVPTGQGYKLLSNPAVAATEGLRTTPIAYTRDKIRHLLKQVSMPTDKIDIMASILENRVPRTLAMLLPQINPHAVLSDPACQKLIAIPKISGPEELKAAFVYLRELLTKPAPSPSGEIDSLAVTLSKLPAPKAPLSLAKPANQTKVKRCENPFKKAGK